MPTPLPGMMPVSLNWTVQHTRPTRREASASTAMTTDGWSRSTSPRTASADSTPVVPNTPGRRAATGRNPEKCWGIASMRCRVMRTLSAASGPTASGVMARFPRPTTSTGPAVRGQLLDLLPHGPHRPVEKPIPPLPEGGEVKGAVTARRLSQCGLPLPVQNIHLGDRISL